MPDQQEVSEFRSTRWTLVGRAGGSSSNGKHEALQELLQIYLPALRSWLNRKYRMDSHHADDLLQDFVVSRILQKDLIKSASEDRGRFRSLLLSSLERFVIDQHRKSQTAKRAPERAASLEVQDDRAAISEDDSGDSFDAAWAHAVIREALQRMKLHCEVETGRAIWLVFTHRVLVPLVTGRDPMSYERLLVLCEFEEPRQASNALVTAKRAFTRSLRSVIEEYSLDDVEIDEELSELKLVLLTRGAINDDFLPEDVRESVAAAAEAPPGETATDRRISGFFSIDATRGSRWGTADVGAMVRHFLDSPISELIDVPASERQWAARSVRALFADGNPPVALLQGVKRAGRSIVKDADEPIPSEVGAYFYFLAIATSVVRTGTSISASPMPTLRAGIERFLKRDWLDDTAANTFSACLKLSR